MIGKEIESYYINLSFYIKAIACIVNVLHLAFQQGQSIIYVHADYYYLPY